MPEKNFCTTSFFMYDCEKGENDMKIQTVELTLGELQEALREYCLQRGHNPNCVSIISYAKSIVVELEPNGLVTADEFRHRA